MVVEQGVMCTLVLPCTRQVRPPSRSGPLTPGDLGFNYRTPIHLPRFSRKFFFFSPAVDAVIEPETSVVKVWRPNQLGCQTCLGNVQTILDLSDARVNF